MRTEDILAAVGYGLWQWDESTGTVTVDGRAARLLGLPGGPATHSTAAVHSRLHAADRVALADAVSHATADGAVAESVLCVIGDDGAVRRTVRARLKPQGGGVLRGTLHEVHETHGPHVAHDIDGVDGTHAVPGVHGPHGVHRLPAHAAAGPAAARRRWREAFLLDAGRALAEADSTAGVLRVAAGLSMPGFSLDGHAVFGVHGDKLSVIGHHGQEIFDHTLLDVSLAADYPAAIAARTGRAIYVSSPEEYQNRFPYSWPIVKPYGRSSWAYLPLVSAGETIGTWMAAFREPVEFTPDERSVLATVARMLGQALSRAHAREAGLALDGLPTMWSAAEAAIEGMTTASRYVPTGGGLQVGGDWYDVIALPSGKTAIVIGDVQGHDARAASLMGQLRIAMRAYAAEGHRPDAVLSRASRFLSGLTAPAGGGVSPVGPGSAGGTPVYGGAVGSLGPGGTFAGGGPGDERFATCLYVEVDPEAGTLDVVRAGHPEPAIRLTDGTSLLQRTAVGLPLGIEADTDYPTTRLVLEPGQVLLLCTDGLIETGGHDLESGWQRLGDALDAGPADRLEDLADALVRAVHGPASHQTTGPLADHREDDIALVLLRRDPVGPTRPRPMRRAVLTVEQNDPARIRTVRHDIGALLYDWASRDQRESAMLLVSELVTNVLVHTDEDAVLIAQVTGEPGARRLHVEVGDRSDEMPHPRSPGEMASSGRGLLLIEGLADNWGVDPRGDGKCIWFDLTEPPAPEAQ